MKKLVAILFVLSLAAMLIPAPTPAQDVDVRVQVKSPPRSYAPVAVRPVYADAPPPPQVVLPRAGSGCYGSSGGCYGKTAGGCHGYSAGCTGFAKSAGCYGSAAAPVGMFATAYGPAPYGARLPDGRYATPTGRPEPPRIIPTNGPVARGARWLFGFDPNY